MEDSLSRPAVKKLRKQNDFNLTGKAETGNTVSLVPVVWQDGRFYPTGVLIEFLLTKLTKLFQLLFYLLN
jgi:hypothetical protein